MTKIERRVVSVELVRILEEVDHVLVDLASRDQPLTGRGFGYVVRLDVEQDHLTDLVEWIQSNFTGEIARQGTVAGADWPAPNEVWRFRSDDSGPRLMCGFDWKANTFHMERGVDDGTLLHFLPEHIQILAGSWKQKLFERRS